MRERDPGITALERAAAAHWQAADTAWLGSWLLRADGGFTGRANSALPLGDPGVPLARAVDTVEEWYSSRGLPPMIVVPGPLPPAGLRDPLDSLLAARGWGIRSGAARVMTARATGVMGRAVSSHTGAEPGAGVTPARVAFADRPDQEWLARYHYRGRDLPANALRLLLSAPWQAFASVRAGGRTVAVGRVSIADGWAGLTAVDVDPRHRRAGLATAITRAAAAEAARHGTERLFLQVEEGNAAARALYARCGFRDAHRYHYRVAPSARVAGAPVPGTADGR